MTVPLGCSVMPVQNLQWIASLNKFPPQPHTLGVHSRQSIEFQIVIEWWRLILSYMRLVTYTLSISVCGFPHWASVGSIHIRMWLVNFLKGIGPEAAIMNYSIDWIWLIASLIALTSSSFLKSTWKHLQGILCNIVDISKSFLSCGHERAITDNHTADFRISTISKSYNLCSHLAQ